MNCELITKPGFIVRNIDEKHTKPGNILIRDDSGLVAGVTDGVVIQTDLWEGETEGMSFWFLPSEFRGLNDDLPLGAHNEMFFACQFVDGEWEEIQRLREEWLEMEATR